MKKCCEEIGENRKKILCVRFESLKLVEFQVRKCEIKAPVRQWNRFENQNRVMN